MKANKHEINGYIYVTSEELDSLNSINGYRIILTNDESFKTIQQLSTKEVEYLKGVDSFEVNDFHIYFTQDIGNKGFYKILIPQETENNKDVAIWFSANTQCKQIENCYNSLSKKCICPKEQPKESIFTSRYQDLFNYLHDLGVITLESELQEIERIVLAKQTMYSEDEMRKALLIKHDGLSIDYVIEQINKHKKQ